MGAHGRQYEPNNDDLTLRLDRHRLTVGAEVIVVLCQLTVGVLQLTSQTKIFGFLFFTLVALTILVWWSSHHHRDDAPTSTTGILMGLILFGFIVGLTIVAWPQIRVAFAQAAEENRLRAQIVNKPVNLAYFVTVHVYQDDGATGVQDGTDPSLPNMFVAIREKSGYRLTGRTDARGDARFQVDHIGQVSVGVCDSSQTHEVEEKNDSDAHAMAVIIGLSPNQVAGCKG